MWMLSATLSASTQVSPSKHVERLSDMKCKGCVRLHVICAVSCAISPVEVEVTHEERLHIIIFSTMGLTQKGSQDKIKLFHQTAVQNSKLCQANPVGTEERWEGSVQID